MSKYPPQLDGRVKDDILQYIIKLENAIKPLADIADVWEKDGLDEDRPDWRNRGIKEQIAYDRVELYCGRGGKRLLTLMDAFKAREALTGKTIPEIKKREIDDLCKKITEKYVTDGSGAIVHVTNCKCKL